MARNTKSKNSQPLTTAQRLSSIVKACRDIMRKDKGLNGDLDRLPMLTWIMFLKFLDDMEQIREEEAKMSGKRFRPALDSPYRWRDWAAKPEGITGDELISFVNNEEAVRPDGTKGPGLFAYMRGLQGANGGDRRDVIATVFKGTINRMINGYLLRDVINKVNDIHFTSSDEIHTLGHLYESMLKEMRDAAGDSGEFYTPRPVVRFMVEVINPQLGEVILDPACGTGGFLVESFKHLEKQCKTVEDRQILQTQSIFGGEAKPLPYLLAQMNLVLHGLESPKIDPLNSLRFPLREIGDRDRVDIIMTNPPFGGEEERGILGNFPEDKQTSETALLFLQLIMRKLKRPAQTWPRRSRRSQRHALRRRHLRPNQRRAAQRLQSPYHRPPPQRRLRSVHEHPNESHVLRPIASDRRGLVLRAAAARRPEELHQDSAHPVRGIRRLPRNGGTTEKKTTAPGKFS